MSDLLKPLLNDTVVGTILGPDGSPVIKPTTILTDKEVRLLREYCFFTAAQRLAPKLGCVTCDADVDVNVEHHQIGIICSHRMLFYQGESPSLRCRFHSPAQATSALQSPTGYAASEITIAIGESDAALLNGYKRLLKKYGLREKLYCNVCDDLGLMPGCEARVVDNGEILIRCRHATRTYKGMVVH